MHDNPEAEGDAGEELLRTRKTAAAQRKKHILCTSRRQAVFLKEWRSNPALKVELGDLKGLDTFKTFLRQTGINPSLAGSYGLV